MARCRGCGNHVDYLQSSNRETGSSAAGTPPCGYASDYPAMGKGYDRSSGHSVVGVVHLFLDK